MTEEEWERNNEYFDSLPNKEKNKIMIESWNDIFDIEPFENEFMSNGRYVQATFWKLDISYVKKVWYLKGYAKPNYYNYNK